MKQPENFSTQYKPQKNKQMPPKAKRIPHAMTLHGDTRIDNYYWLRDDDRSQAEVLDYLRQENEYGKKVMSSQSSLQDRVLKEIIDRIPQREVSAPLQQKWLSLPSGLRAGLRVRDLSTPAGSQRGVG